MKKFILRNIKYFGLCVLLAVLLTGVYTSLYKLSYSSSRFVLLFEDENNIENVLILKLTSREIFPHFYKHGYSAILINEKRSFNSEQHLYKTFSKSFKANNFISRFENINNENILNENYFLNFKINDKNFNLELKNLTNDFLINNSLDRFAYINMGETNIVVNDIEQPAYFVVNKMTSMDYKKILKLQDIEAEGEVVFLVNNEGEMYYADTTNVVKGKGNYLSHSWALNKNNDILKKSVSKEIKFSSEDDYALEIPAFDNSYFRMKKSNIAAQGKTKYSIIKGELISDKGEKKVKGFGLNYNTVKYE